MRTFFVKVMQLCVGVLISLSLFSCAGARWQKPEISLADISVAGGNLFESKLALTLRVHNRNDRDITVDSLVFDILLGERIVASGVRGEPIVIGRMSDTLVELKGTARTLDLLQQLAQEPVPDGRVAYRVRGEADIHDYGKVPFDRRDSFAMPKSLQSK